MIDKLAAILPGIDFTPGENYFWSPADNRITYADDTEDKNGQYALLHETGHALLGHRTYQTDYQLLKMEVEAWEKAKEIAAKLGIKISENHIQECLDSYRDWLYKRCICPSCGTKTIQNDTSNSYSCFNCHACWQVSPSRFCRAYRTKKEQELVII